MRPIHFVSTRYIVFAVALLAACKRGDRSSLPNQPSFAADASVDDLWARAREEETDDLAQLARREGAAGLIEVAEEIPALRLTAVRALGYADGWFALPWLAERASEPDTTFAYAAVDSISALAARPRRSEDAEDLVAFRIGCEKLVRLAQNARAALVVRVSALRAIRMLADRGCGTARVLPSDLDAR